MQQASSLKSHATATQPILTDLDACASVNGVALEAHDSAMQMDPPNYGRLILSYVYYGWVHDGVSHIPTPPHLSVDLQVGALSNRATALRDMGSFQRAADVFDQVLQTQARINDPRRIDTLVNVSNLHVRAGNLPQAHASASQAVELAQQLHAQCKVAAQSEPAYLPLVESTESKLINALNQVFNVAEARAMELEALRPGSAKQMRLEVAAMYCAVLGETHPESVQTTAIIQNNIGQMYNKQASHKEAMHAFELACAAAKLAKLDLPTQSLIAGRLRAAKASYESSSWKS